tara:strand:- start:11551 stop:11748 length:198 start_codon:yes stop_codon:yes gene_type:complete
MKKFLKDNWIIIAISIFTGLLNGFTDLSVGKKIVYLIVFSILLPLIIYLYKNSKNDDKSLIDPLI